MPRVSRRTAVLNRVPTEHEEQREFVSWFRKNHDGVRIFAIPNGGARSPSVAAQMKVEGVSKGVPDLYIPAWGLWVEMKRTKGGIISPEQQSWHDYLKGLEFTVIVPNGCEEAKKMIEEFKHDTDRSS